LALTRAESAANREKKGAADTKRVMSQIVELLYPDWNAAQVGSLIEDAFRKQRNYEDKEALEAYLRLKFPAAPEKSFAKLVGRLETTVRLLKTEETYLYYIISEIVRREFGEEERLQYLITALRGRAN